MPLVAFPIKAHDEIIGVFEVINAKGIQGLSSTGKSQMLPKDLETFEFFAKQLGQAIVNQISLMTEKEKGNFI